jgi:hypothetical protein
MESVVSGDKYTWKPEDVQEVETAPDLDVLPDDHEE